MEPCSEFMSGMTCSEIDVDIIVPDTCPGLQLHAGTAWWGDTRCAALDDVGLACGPSIEAPGLWYRVEGEGRYVTVSTCGSDDTDFDTAINVYCAGCGDFVCVGGNDDSEDGDCTAHGQGRESRFSWCAVDGGVYHILVQGSQGATGQFRLDIESGEPCDTGDDACVVPQGACCWFNGSCFETGEDWCLGDWSGGLSCDEIACHHTDCVGADGDCWGIEPNDTPGCADPDCCTRVAQEESACADSGWDADCANLAWLLCDGPSPRTLLGAVPAMDETLWRSAGNVIRLSFDDAVSMPPAGAVTIREMRVDGAFGPDLSSSFSMSVEGAALKIVEEAHALTHGKWYAVENIGEWHAAAPFLVHYLCLVGDANNDGRVLPNDLSAINSLIPAFCDPPCYRADINGDGDVLPNDLSIANRYVPSFGVAKPAGHK